MQNDVKIDGRSITAENHTLVDTESLSDRWSAVLPSATVCVPGISPEGHPHMQKVIDHDSSSITAKNHSHGDVDVNSHGRLKAYSMTEYRLAREGDER